MARRTAKTLDEAKKIKPVDPKTEAQGAYMRAILGHSITFGIGPAGTGKTYIAASLACEMLLEGDVDRVIVTRPAMPAGEDIGYLPGAVGEKFAPYFAPVEQVFREHLGQQRLAQMIKSGQILALPLAFMRGWTFRDCFVILDEAQNTTPAQMKLFLTRLGEPVRCVVDGDPSQRDMRGSCGMMDAIERLEGTPDVAVVRFGRADVVRSGLCARICAAYET